MESSLACPLALDGTFDRLHVLLGLIKALKFQLHLNVVHLWYARREVRPYSERRTRGHVFQPKGHQAPSSLPAISLGISPSKRAGNRHGPIYSYCGGPSCAPEWGFLLGVDPPHKPGSGLKPGFHTRQPVHTLPSAFVARGCDDRSPPARSTHTCDHITPPFRMMTLKH